MTWAAADYHFMSRAIQLAWRGRYTCHPNPRVGCVITRDDKLLGEGWHQVTGDAHAEVNAINAAGDVKGSRIYLTLEPCSHQGRTPPCADALVEAGVAEAVIAMLDPNPRVAGKGIEKLEAAGIKTQLGLLQAEARKLNRGFCKRMEQDLPLVTIKLAMSVDGRTALANGNSQWISSVASRKNVHQLRAQAAAILTSINTVIADDPSLNVRDIDIEYKQPLRVIIDRQLQTPGNARLLSLPGKTIIYTASDKMHDLQDDSVDVISIVDSASWLTDVLTHLAKHYEVNEVMVEAGAKLTAALIKAGLVDELLVYMAPMLLGSDAKPLLDLNGFNELDDSVKLTLVDTRQLGGDIRLTYQVKNRN